MSPTWKGFSELDTAMVELRIWVDADGCPAVIKDILFRAAERSGVVTTFVANHLVQVPKSKFIRSRQVSQGFDVADNVIVELVSPGDLVITQDIPLAADVINKGGAALSPRGEMFSSDSIAGRLTMRNFLDTMRSSGIQSGGPPPLAARDRQLFANQLDSYLAKQHLTKQQ